MGDDGVTLVELIVYVAVSSLVLAGMAVMFANGLTEQRKAAERDRVTGPANTISTSLAELRNATAVTPVTTEAGDGIVAAIVDESGDIYCRAWIVGDAGDVAGDLLYRAAPDPRRQAAPDAREQIDMESDVFDWNALSRHIDEDGRVDAVTGSISYSSATRSVDIDLVVTVGTARETQIIEIKNTVIAQAIVPGTEGFSCIPD